MNRILHTPEGVRDLYGSSLKNKRKVTERMMDKIEGLGYEPIETPAFEYFDVFSKETGTIPSNELYKFFDSEGNTLALRPDFTPSIARVSAKYFKNENKAIRLCYSGNVFINHKSYQGRLKERAQLGAEFIGDASYKADLEIINMSIECLKAAGLIDFRISMGHAGIFKGLMEIGDFNPHETNKIKSYISNKNFYGLSHYLTKIGTEDNIKNIFETLFTISPIGNLDELIKLTLEYKTINNALTYLKSLKEQQPKISFDLSMTSDYSYYTGIMFVGYAYGSGAPVLSGGRYDDLLKYFGKDAPAIGMAVLIDNVLAALDNYDNTKPEDRYLTVALGKGRLAKQAMKLFEKIGIECHEIFDKDTRKLIFVNEEMNMRFFLAKVPDVPTYVEHGAADIGIVGLDTILEENRNIYEVLDLGFGKCKMCVCGLPEAKELLSGSNSIRIGTKYPKIAKDYFFNEKGQTAEIIKLNGSIELAPILGLSDVIVDIVETGTTLKENGLEILEEVCDLSAKVVVNNVSMRIQHERISHIIQSLREVVNANL